MTISISRLQSVAIVSTLVLVYSALIVIVYGSQIVPTYSDVGFTLHSPSMAEWSVMCVLALGPGLWLKPQCERPSDSLVWSMYVLGYVPLCFIPFLASDGYAIGRGRLFELVAWCGVGMTLIVLGRSWVRRAGRPRVRRLGRDASRITVVMVSALTYGLSLLHMRGFTIVGFDQVMDIRDQLTEGAKAGGPILSYLVLTQSHAVNPMLMAVGLERARWSMFVAGMLGQIFFYAAGGLRAVVMSPLLVIGTWLATRHDGRRFGYYVLSGAICALTIFLLLVPPANEGGRTWIIARAMIWRTLVIPPHTVGIYFDAFSHMATTHFSHVKGFSLFLRNPYDEPIPFIVARWFYGKPFSLNGGLFAEGFAGWGVAGIIISASVATTAFAVLDALTTDLPRRLVVLAVSFHAINLTNLSIFTLLLGSGLGASILLLGFLSRSFAMLKSDGRVTSIDDPGAA